jgi:membrane fusion protein (multidrug efflux system)
MLGINEKKMFVVKTLTVCLTIAWMSLSMAYAQEAPPPAKVVVSHISLREIAENQPFIGTLYYDRSSQVSSEVSGLVEVISVQKGDTVTKDAPMIRLDTHIL